MGPLLAFIAVICLMAAAALAAQRNARMDAGTRQSERRVLATAVLNLLPGLGLWVVAKRPGAALRNFISALAAAFIGLWLLPRFLPSWSDPLTWCLWIEIASVAWGYHGAMPGIVRPDAASGPRLQE